MREPAECSISSGMWRSCMLGLRPSTLIAFCEKDPGGHPRRLPCIHSRGSFPFPVHAYPAFPLCAFPNCKSGVQKKSRNRGADDAQTERPEARGDALWPGSPGKYMVGYEGICSAGLMVCGHAKRARRLKGARFGTRHEGARGLDAAPAGRWW